MKWPGIQIEDLDVNGDIALALAVTFLFVRKGAACTVVICSEGLPILQQGQKPRAWWRMTGSVRIIITRGMERVKHLGSAGTGG